MTDAMTPPPPTSAPLLPCPFCRRQPEMFTRAAGERERDNTTGRITFISCMGGGYSAHAHHYGHTEAEAIAAWNTRAAHSQPQPTARKTLSELQEFVGEAAKAMGQIAQPTAPGGEADIREDAAYNNGARAALAAASQGGEALMRFEAGIEQRQTLVQEERRAHRPSQTGDMRAAFEKWYAREKASGQTIKIMLASHEVYTNCYKSRDVQLMWEGYQAGTASTTQAQGMGLTVQEITDLIEANAGVAAPGGRLGIVNADVAARAIYQRLTEKKE